MPRLVLIGLGFRVRDTNEALRRAKRRKKRKKGKGEGEVEGEGVEEEAVSAADEVALLQVRYHTPFRFCSRAVSGFRPVSLQVGGGCAGAAEQTPDPVLCFLP